MSDHFKALELSSLRLCSTTQPAVNTTEISVTPIRFTLRSGDSLFFVDRDTSTFTARRVRIFTGIYATILYLNFPISLSNNSIVLLDGRFIRDEFRRHDTLIERNESNLSQVEAGLAQLSAMSNQLSLQQAANRSDLFRAIINLNAVQSIAKIQRSVRGFVYEFSVANLRATILPGDELYLLDRRAQTVFRVMVSNQAKPASKATIQIVPGETVQLFPFRYTNDLQVSDNSYVHLSLSTVSSRIALILEQLGIEVTLGDIPPPPPEDLEAEFGDPGEGDKPEPPLAISPKTVFFM